MIFIKLYVVVIIIIIRIIILKFILTIIVIVITFARRGQRGSWRRRGVLPVSPSA